MEKAACRSCHNPDGVASPTRLHFPEPDAAPEKIEAFGRSLVILVDRERPDNSLLLKKPTNRIPHAGGERIKPGSPDEAVLKAWIERLTQLSGVELTRALKYREEEASGVGQPAAADRPSPPDAQPVQSHRPRFARRPDLARRTSFRPRISSTVSAISRRRRIFRRC